MDEPFSLLGLLSVLSCLLVVTYASGFCHECGHALMARWGGMRVTSFGMGTGRPFLVTRWSGTRIYLCRQNPFQGITFLFVLRTVSRPALVGMVAGGILAHFVLIAGGLLLWWLLPWGGLVWLTIVALNGLFAFVNLMPFNFQVGKSTLYSDGRMILRSLRGNVLDLPAPSRIRCLRAFRGLWESVGDQFGCCVYLLDAAFAWLELGRPDQAVRFCDEAEQLSMKHPSDVQGLILLVRAILARKAGDLDSALAVLEQAETAFREAGYDTGSFQAVAERAETLFQQGEHAQAMAILEGLATHPLALNPAGVERFAAGNAPVHAGFPG